MIAQALLKRDLVAGVGIVFQTVGLVHQFEAVGRDFFDEGALFDAVTCVGVVEATAIPRRVVEHTESAARLQRIVNGF